MGLFDSLVSAFVPEIKQAEKALKNAQSKATTQRQNDVIGVALQGLEQFRQQGVDSAKKFSKAIVGGALTLAAPAVGGLAAGALSAVGLNGTVKKLASDAATAGVKDLGSSLTNTQSQVVGEVGTTIKQQANELLQLAQDEVMEPLADKAKKELYKQWWFWLFIVVVPGALLIYLVYSFTKKRRR